jgi:hypothetical protein
MNTSDRAVRRAFSLIEVMACLLLLTLGFFAILLMVLWGQRIASDAQGRATGLITAQSALVDTAPPGSVGTDEQPGLTATIAGALTTHKGWLNGYYVVRNEVQVPADALSPDQRWVEVEASVYRGIDGGQVATIRRRMIRQGR